MTKPELASAEECRPLYELLGQVRDLAPWKWMEEDQIFGVQDPNTGELSFVSIMGQAGEHYAVAAYQGMRGFYGFMNLLVAGPNMGLEGVLQTPQLQASLEDREMVEQRDRDQMKTLGLKYRGRNAWPLFRSYRPGYLPWFLEPDEARTLRHVLEQVLEVTPRVRENPDILIPDNDDDKYLVRVAERDGQNLKWQDTVMSFGPPQPLDLKIEVDEELLETVKGLPKSRARLDADFFVVPGAIGEKGERPQLPYMLILVDGTKRIVLDIKALTAEPSLEAMWGRLGMEVLGMIGATGSIPQEIRVRHDLLHGILTMLGSVIGFKVKQSHDMFLLDQMAEGLMDFMTRS